MGRKRNVERWLEVVRLHETMSLTQIQRLLKVTRTQVCNLLRQGRAEIRRREGGHRGEH